MRAVEVLNLSRGVLLAARARQAETWWERMKGLLGTASLPDDEAMVIAPCNSVHSFFMQYPFDVVLAGSDGVVHRVFSRLGPHRVTPPVWGAHYAIELPAGVVERSGTAAGDQLQIRESG